MYNVHMCVYIDTVTFLVIKDRHGNVNDGENGSSFRSIRMNAAPKLPGKCDLVVFEYNFLL